MHTKRNSSEADKQVPVYYDQIDTHNFYQKVSGGEHIHIGLFKHQMKTWKRLRSVQRNIWRNSGVVLSWKVALCLMAQNISLSTLVTSKQNCTLSSFILSAYSSPDFC